MFGYKVWGNVWHRHAKRIMPTLSVTRDGRYQLFLSIRYLLDILLFLPISIPKSIFSIQSSIDRLK